MWFFLLSIQYKVEKILPPDITEINYTAIFLQGVREKVFACSYTTVPANYTTVTKLKVIGENSPTNLNNHYVFTILLYSFSLSFLLVWRAPYLPLYSELAVGSFMRCGPAHAILAHNNCVKTFSHRLLKFKRTKG